VDYFEKERSGQKPGNRQELSGNFGIEGISKGRIFLDSGLRNGILTA